MNQIVKDQLEKKWNVIRDYVKETKPELWDEDLDTVFRTVVLD